MNNKKKFVLVCLILFSISIITLWIWIPRYTYAYLNINTPQQIDIKFESGTESTGTIKCVDAVLGNGTTSRTCTDTTNGSLTVCAVSAR